MNKTLALRTVVVSLLGTVMPDGAKTYYQQAQKDHPKIYAVYTLDQIDLTDGRYTYELEINVMDYGTDTSTIEDLAEVEHRVTVLMGDKVEPRREYITSNANFNREDDFEPVTAD